MKLFTKTYHKDIEWLGFAIESVVRHCTEDFEWTIVCDTGERHLVYGIIPAARSYQFKVIEVHEFLPDALELKNGYLQQQWVKMNAHKVMGLGNFWNYDSDVIAIRPFSSKDLIGASGRPIYWITPTNDIVDPVNQNVYIQRSNLLKEIFGLRRIAFEWMRCMPICLVGEILRCGSEQPEWKTFFELCKQGNGNVSEFNAIGQFAHLNFPDAFEWRNTNNYSHTWMSHPGNGANQPGGWSKAVEMTSAIFFQGWSWGGIPEEMRKSLRSQ